MRDKEAGVLAVIDRKNGRAAGAASALVALALMLFTRPAAAELIIDDNGAVPDFTVEIEPHGVLTPFWPPRGSAEVGVGLGALVGINLAPRGFIPTVADTVSLGVGLDWVKYFGGRPSVGECVEWVGDSPDEEICVRTRGGGGAGTYVFAPVVMQWSFYLTEKWSVFGEPGLAMYFYSGGIENRLRLGLTPVFNLGGRFHFSERAALTMRVGYPYTTAGISLYF
jgi:hypothetical protein